jgi:hypothetical protein
VSHKPAKSALPISIALALVAASLGLGIWLVFSDLSKPKTITQTTIPLHSATADAPVQPASSVPEPKFWADPAEANWDKKFFNLKSPDALRKTSDSSWSVKGGRLFMQVHRDKTRKLVVRFVYPFEEMLPKDTLAMLRSRWTPWETHKLVDELQISAAQWETFMAVDPNTDTQISAADRKTIMTLFNDAVKAFNQNETVNGGLPTVPEEKLTDYLRDLDQKYYQVTFDKANRAANEVKSIFTDLQYTGLMRRYSTW